MWVGFTVFMNLATFVMPIQREIYDWYCPNRIFFYSIFNMQNIRMVEILSFVLGVYLTRNFPKSFNIQQELIIFSVIFVVLDSYYEWTTKFPQIQDGCTFMSIKDGLLVNMVRGLLFCLSVNYFFTPQDVDPPAPADPFSFQEFTMIPKYRRLFLKYLTVVDPGKCELLKSLLAKRSQIGDGVSVYSIEDSFSQEYREFRRTVSFKTARQLVEKDANAFYLGIDRL